VPPPDYRERLLFVLHRGWGEARNCCELTKQVFDLADAMHNIPCYLAKPLEGYWELILDDLRRYHAKWPNSSTDFVLYLEGKQIPPWYMQ
jgi:hypothetical protein